MTRTRPHALLPVLVLALLAWLGTCVLRSPRTVASVYVSQQDGNDSRSCQQATSASAPLRSINKGASCLEPGGTLVIAAGTYDELLISQTSSSRTCSSGDAATQIPCAPFPNGLSASQPTRLVASGPDVILSPVSRQWPGGGSAINVMDYARFIHIEGIRVVRNTASGSVGGIYVGNAQHITLQGNTLDDGQIKGGSSSKFLQVLGNTILNTGQTQCPANEKPTPSRCPHGMYICGTDHAITDNVIQNTSYYGIQVSCESGRIARIRIERNRVENNPGNGIRCAGEQCVVVANLLRGNGQAITLTGSGVVAGNTIDGYYQASWNPDPWGIYTTWGDGSGFQITNNIFTRMKNTTLQIGNAAMTPVDTRLVHHNIGETAGHPGVTLIASASSIYTNASAGDFTLKAGSPAIRAGVAYPHGTTDITGTPYPTPADLGAYSSQSPPPTTDTTPPTVRLTNPPNNEQVFGTALPLVATASDNIGVVQVQFQMDGAAVGEAVTSPPYQVLWNTTTVSNGNHTLSAVATDGAGNQSVATSTLRVDNPTPPEPPDQAVLACSGTITGTQLAFTCTKP